MDGSQHSSGGTSNDLLFDLAADRWRISLKCQVVEQNAEEVQDIQNGPAVSMGTSLLECGHTYLLTTISIYSRRGEKSGASPTALYERHCSLIWKAMGKLPKPIGALHRPPQTPLRLEFHSANGELHYLSP